MNPISSILLLLENCLIAIIMESKIPNTMESIPTCPSFLNANIAKTNMNNIENIFFTLINFELSVMFSDLCRLSIIEHSAGVIVIAITKDETIANITVMGIGLIKAPIIPVVKAIGKNADTVVSMDEKTAGAIWLVPTIAASLAVRPLNLNLSIFSIITIPLSTSMPTARTSEKSVIVFNVIPKYLRSQRAVSMDKGITAETTNASPNPIKRNRTIKTINKPEIAFSVTPPSCSSTYFEVSPLIYRLKSSG